MKKTGIVKSKIEKMYEQIDESIREQETLNENAGA